MGAEALIDAVVITNRPRTPFTIDGSEVFDYGSEGCVFESRRVHCSLSMTYVLNQASVSIAAWTLLGHFLISAVEVVDLTRACCVQVPSGYNVTLNHWVVGSIHTRCNTSFTMRWPTWQIQGSAETRH
jgi:hypothetical protein